ncbi:nodulin MtN21 /EamA-like transporter family protein [Arabidopsis thaliana]|uniref:Nodulin MtN21 /EamA-like transporter family protein n=1 Tax=Arabidopsis thaliana TaxID=3702 RepID=A0A1I9LS29_ARATH|nr:nodulin MtN21 /EamA-like transporter family protein [Arabidopsis thaliana]ANM65387.1 nodulin MtN21 /EamA-like transporter family protein [Arabidopsis thaliana]|eukprot:NP_001327361.1 nodulin MtN21 /EamA-like transporter family protein [Arabidopsis thaliana]
MLQPFSRRSRFLLSSWLSLWGKDSIQSFSFTFSLTLPNLEQSIFVCCCRTERLNLFKLEGQAKVGGTLICVAGAVLMVLFRGLALFGETEAESLGHGESRHTETSGHFMSGFFNGLGRWNLGVLCLIGNCTCMAAFLAIQAPVLKKYPANLSVTAYSYFFGTMFMVTSAFFMTNESTNWSLTRSEFFAVVYAVCSSHTICLLIH